VFFTKKRNRLAVPLRNPIFFLSHDPGGCGLAAVVVAPAVAHLVDVGGGAADFRIEDQQGAKKQEPTKPVFAHEPVYSVGSNFRQIPEHNKLTSLSRL
jgi:hypothetical protein